MPDPGDDADARYARGEITREEWLRMRNGSPDPAQTAASSGPAPTPRPRAVSGRVVFLVVVVVVGVAVVAAFLWSVGGPGGSGWAPVYGSAKELQVSDLAALNASATSGRAFMGNNTLWFGPGPMTLVVYGSPPAHDMAFMIRGMVNPTLHMAAGSRVTVVMVNMDPSESHTWSLTAQGPPYGSSMMGSGGMMSGLMMGTSSLAPMSSMGMWSQQMSFSPQAGTYWYVCAVSDHAASGMYGEMIVG